MASSTGITHDASPLVERSSDDCSLTKVQARLWSSLQERIRKTHQRQLLSAVDDTIRQYYPSYCSNEGRIVDRRLAKRVGISPGTISRMRGEGEGTMTRLTHFLSMMYLCGISWEEAGFMRPQQAVLDGMAHCFPIAQAYLGEDIGTTPSTEQVLLLYLASNTKDWEEIFRERVNGNDTFVACCEELVYAVSTFEIDTEHDPIRVVPTPIETTPQRIERVWERYGDTWKLLRDTFPFLGKPDAKGNSWGIL